MDLINKDEKIFIAGHKGMVGSAIYRFFKNKGYKNLLTVSREEVDLMNTSSVEHWFSREKPDITIIAAAKVGGIFANKKFPADFLFNNLKLQNNLIEYSWKNNVRRLLFLGSSCIYPKFAVQPIREEALLTGELESTNEWYSIAKISGLKLCEALREQYGFDAIGLMPTNLYGPGDNYHLENSHVIPALLRKFYEAKINNLQNVICWGTGSPKREFLHVDDLADACEFVLNNWDPSSKNSPLSDAGKPLTFLNVGSGVDLKIKDLANLIGRVVGFDGQIKWDHSKPDGTPRKNLDVKRLNNIGWVSKIKLENGLETTFEEFKKKYDTKTIRSF